MSYSNSNYWTLDIDEIHTVPTVQYIVFRNFIFLNLLFVVVLYYLNEVYYKISNLNFLPIHAVWAPDK